MHTILHRYIHIYIHTYICTVSQTTIPVPRDTGKDAQAGILVSGVEKVNT